MGKNPLGSSTKLLSPRLTSNQKNMPLLPHRENRFRPHPSSPSGHPCSVTGENGIRLFQGWANSLIVYKYQKMSD